MSETFEWPNEPVATGRVQTLLVEVGNEVRRGMTKFPKPQNSPHEGYAVLLEEVDELWDHVKQNTGRGVEARKEAIQVAAMALRYIYEVCT